MQTPILELSKWKGEDLFIGAKPTEPRMPSAEVEAATKIASSSSHVKRNPSNSSERPSNNNSNPAPTSSAPLAVAHQRDKKIPDVSGAWIASNGIRYNYWQKGKIIGWEMRGETLRGVISDDGRMTASQWRGKQFGSGTAKLETDANSRCIKMTTNDGIVLQRPETLHAAHEMMTKAHDLVEPTGSAGASQVIPIIAGTWMDERKLKYKFWQEGNKFGWRIARLNETGTGIINPGGKSGSCQWTGTRANSATFSLETDNHNRGFRMRTPNGGTITRCD